MATANGSIYIMGHPTREGIIIIKTPTLCEPFKCEAMEVAEDGKVFIGINNGLAFSLEFSVWIRGDRGER